MRFCKIWNTTNKYGRKHNEKLKIIADKIKSNENYNRDVSKQQNKQIW
jgi:hypothetical protein